MIRRRLLEGDTPLETVEELHLWNSQVSDLRALHSRCTILKKIDLSGCKNITSASLRNIGCLPSVTDLDLNNTLIDDINFINDVFPNLRSINISGCVNIANASIRGLSKCVQLEQVDLGRTAVDDISCLRSCNNLRSLTRPPMVESAGQHDSE